MALSVRLEPSIEAQLEQHARKLGMTKSEFVKDAIERALGLRNPADLLAVVRSNQPMGKTDASENVSRQVKAKLRAKRSS
jgi:predicted transcriptional regulator